LKDKSFIVLYAISLIIILYGVSGIGVVIYVHSRIGDIYSVVNTIADQLLLTSDNLKELKEYPLVSGEMKSQIDRIESSMQETNQSLYLMSRSFDSMAISIDIDFLGWRPFGSVADLLRSVASTSSSVGMTFIQAYDALVTLEELKVKDVLSEKYLSIVDAYLGLFAYYGNTMKQSIWAVPYALIYIGITYVMFILIGASVALLTKKVEKVLRVKSPRGT